MPKKDDSREYRMASPSRRVKEHSSVDRKSLKLPKGLTLFNPKKPGVYKVEIIPFKVGKRSKQFAKNYAEVGDYYYERTYFCHFGVGPNNDAVVCPARTFNKPCPVCQARDKMRNSPKHDEDAAKALNPKERQLFLLYDLAEPQKGRQLWDVSNWNFGKQLDAKLEHADDEDKERYDNFYHPKKGSTLKLAAGEENSGGGRKYLLFDVDEIRPRRQVLDPELFDHDICLDDVPVEMPYDEMKKLFLQEAAEGDSGEGDDDENDDDAPAWRDNSRNKSKKNTHEDDDDEDEDDDKDSDEESAEFEVGDDVQFTYKGKLLRGKVVKVNAKKEIAEVDVGKDKPQVVDLDALELAKGEPEDDDDEDEDEDGPPPVKKGAKGGKKEPPPDDDEDEDEDDADSDDDDDDEPPPPKGKKGAKGKPAPAEDDDDPFDDEDEDDDPPPVKKGKKK